MTAALIVALLLFVSGAHAQTITNTARATWSETGLSRATNSNTVRISVKPAAPISLDTFHPVPNGSTTLGVRASICGTMPLDIFPGSAGTSIGISSTQTNELRIGEILIIRAFAPLANRDPAAVDQVTATLTTQGGDREVLQIYETGVNTGVFTGAIRTRGAPPATLDNCQLGVTSGETITVAIGRADGSAPLLSTLVAVLADPYGFVFDSEDGTPVSGARVSLVDAATGAPAIVFADDGITPWPPTVISGQSVSDAAGNVYQMQPGEYRFPLAPLGTYRIVIEPPAPYSAPSKVTADGLAGLTRPGGEPFVISDASYGAAFGLNSPLPVRVDIPIDRPNTAVTISKSVSRARAQPGDAVFYTVSLQNLDPERVKRGVTLIDLPSPWLRLRTDSIRVNGEAASEAVTIAPDGRKLAIAIPDIAPGASARVTYAMVVSANAPAGQAINRAEAIDLRGGISVAEASIRIERDTIASRMSIIGQVTVGSCRVTENRPGLPGVRVMLEDGSFAITDIEGRYHFEGVVPGTHVVQVQRQTLPEGGHFTDCDRSSRTAGSEISHFVIGQGGSLVVADFTAEVPGWIPPPPRDEAPVSSVSETVGDLGSGDNEIAAIFSSSTRKAAGGDTDWLALGDGPTDFLFPQIDHNPRAPAIRVVIRHRMGQTVELSANGKPVDKLAFDGTKVAASGLYAVDIWRGIPLTGSVTRLHAVVRNADGSIANELDRTVDFVSSPWRAEILPELSNLVADGKTRPVVAVRLTDRRGRPVRSGLTGAAKINAPYESAALLDQLQLQQLSGAGSASPSWTVDGDDGVALIELAPTMVSGPLHIGFAFVDDQLTRQQEIDSWIVPGDLDWTIVGLAEGSIGAKTVADNMERTGSFDSDLGDKARVALYAKGRVLGQFIMTMAYDSARQTDDHQLLGSIDPKAYYTVFADGSDRRFDAASREKLYLRIETNTFYALYGDFVTGFDQTVLARYNRTATGLKLEGQFGAIHAQAFAADISTRYRRDEIQGNGLSGPYRLRDRDIVSNSERVAIEVRDRLRSEIVVSRRELVRFIDYNIDTLSGTISFKEPVLSRDFDLNPQFIVIDYEAGNGVGDAAMNAGVRADYTLGDDSLRIGVTGITDKGDGPRSDIGAIDLRARIGATTEIRAELGVSRTDGQNAEAWLIEAEHRTGQIDLIAYARSLDETYGTGQQTGAELGRRKFGVDGRYAVDQHLSLTASAWYDESLIDISNRRAVQLGAVYRTGATEARVGIAHFSDELADGTKGNSTILEAAVSQRLLGDKLELSATTSVALGKTDSIDLPARHRLRARYSVTDWLRAIGTYEIANGDKIKARTVNGGFELSPWQGARMVTTLGQQDIAEQGKRSFAAFGLAQTFAVNANLSVDATIDGNRSIGGNSVFDVINPEHPVASGGFLSQDGALFEDFTAVTLGAAWRKDDWAATGRGEYRDGEYANRTGFTGGVIRQLGNGIVVGSGVSWTLAKGDGGVQSEILDATLSAAYRPDESPFAALAKIEFRSDRVAGAVAGQDAPVGRTALTVTGDAKSERLVASISTNWSPHGKDDEELVRRTEIGLFVGGRYNLDRVEDFNLSGTTVLGGLDARIGVGDRIELGGSATVRKNLDDGTTSFAVGPQIGLVPAKNALVTIGYNVSGFRDRDFSAARNTDRGVYASVRLKFDADTFSFLGLRGAR